VYVPRSSSHSKYRNMSNSSSFSKLGHKDSQDLTLECPTTPPLPRPNQVTPSKSSKQQDKQDKERKLLTSMVQALSQKLKKLDEQEQALQEKVDKFIEVTLQLESAEERLVDTVAENQALSRRVKNLQSTIDMESVGSKATRRKAAVEITNCNRDSEQRIINEAELITVRQQRDSALLKTSEMAIAVAESRSEADQLRDQLATITTLLQQQKCVSSAVPESPVFVGQFSQASLVMSSLPTNLASLWKSPTKVAKTVIV
jgi:DNA repair exonuclease SbcCD ATPase subunit